MNETNKRISAHFSLTELTHSATALRRGISNRPGPSEIANLTALAVNILEPVRQNFAIPFRPSSGFRTLILNQLIGSEMTSQHITGQAVDFEIPGIPNLELAGWIKNNLKFDQLILEFYRSGDPRSGWVHCSYVDGGNRHQCLIFDGKKYEDF